jgi:hypothetical protein
VARPLVALNRAGAVPARILAIWLIGAALLALPIASDVGLGQAPPAGAPPALSPAARAAVDERIAQLKTQLGITAAQEPLWSAFAEAMRDNAAATDALFTERAATVANMSAVENMHSYAKVTRAYADNTERLASAFDSLYASLSETQKRAADTLFREPAAAAAKSQ